MKRLIAPAEPLESEPEYLVGHFQEFGFTVVAHVKQFVVEFEVYEIFGTDDGSIVWVSVKGDEYVGVDQLADARLFLKGEVKQNGWSNWHFVVNEEALITRSTRSCLTDIGEIMAKCWDIAKDLIPTFDGKQ